MAPQKAEPIISESKPLKTTLKKKKAKKTLLNFKPNDHSKMILTYSFYTENPSWILDSLKKHFNSCSNRVRCSLVH